jgi:hypothetical protein
MTTTREDLRDHLTAIIEAAQELPKEDRPYLADSFLDELETQFQLVPRERGAQRTGADSARPWFTGSPLGWWPALVGLMFLLPVLLLSFFVLVHPPVFLLALVLLLLFRFGRPGMRRGRPWQHGPRRGGMSHHNL